VKAVLGYIQTKVQAGEDVQLVGFGTFKQVERAVRTGRNLITLVFGISIVARISEGQIGEPTISDFA
jgi:nucleoid DNA-binding protein